MRLEFEVAGDKLISRELIRVGQRAGDARPAFGAIADYMIEETRQQFATEGAHASGGWQKLKPVTIARKAAHQPPLDTRILHATGRLVASLTNKSDGDMLLETSLDEMRYGSHVPYADVHQRPQASNPLPRRRPVEFTEQAKRHIVKVLQRWIMVGEVAA